MKKVLSAIFSLVLLIQFTVGQEKPLTQAEYVKMLYALQKDPGSKQDIIAALRKRGIDFVLTDGIRSLTRSKGGNDEELKRALEEAGRRKADIADWVLAVVATSLQQIISMDAACAGLQWQCVESHRALYGGSTKV